jgi:hypothetical protein
MSRLTLDLNALGVESFSPAAAAGDPARGTITAAYLCEQNAGTPMTLTNRVCCEAVGVEACTVREPCCDVTP